MTIDATRAAQLWKLNHRLVTEVLHASTAELDGLGLETKEFFVLDEVTASPYPAELADRLLIPRASVTAYVRSLVAKGLLRREIDEADLRRHRLALTDAGEAALVRARDAIAVEFDGRLTRVDPRDRAELQRILVGMLEADRAEGGEPRARPRATNRGTPVSDDSLDQV